MSNCTIRLVFLGDQKRHLVAHLGIARVDGSPHRGDLGLAVAVTEMRQNVDRRMGDEIDVVIAARQRALDIAGIESLEEIQHALPVEIFGHFFSAGVRSRLAVPGTHCEPNFG
jgi:hypothetical protein